MAEPVIDKTVDKKIDTKIEQAKLPPILSQSIEQQELLHASTEATTTAEENLRTQAQRDVNLVWENTQRFIAIFVVITTMLVSGTVVIRAVFIGVSDANLAIAAFTFISSTTSLVVGFYFSRTNHARIGDDQKTTKGGLDDR